MINTNLLSASIFSSFLTRVAPATFDRLCRGAVSNNLYVRDVTYYVQKPANMLIFCVHISYDVNFHAEGQQGGN